MLDDPQLFTVTDLKQFSYCPRVVYYERCLPHLRPRTFKMDAGRDRHEHEQKLALRRTLHKYGVLDGRREFDVTLTDPVGQLTGVLDEVVYGADGTIFPVDYKLADQVGSNHKVQLAAYAHLLTQATGQPVHQGYIYLIKPRRLEAVAITPALRQTVATQLTALRMMVTAERMPPPTEKRSRCVACEFRRFCNDV
ncbi:MAG: CRISPR-associated protein Cas4 [Caldilineaceae bacterium]